jgi:hypothetical protein
MKNDTSKKEQARKKQLKVANTHKKMVHWISCFLKLAFKYALKLAFEDFTGLDADVLHESESEDTGPLDNYYLEGILF